MDTDCGGAELKASLLTRSAVEPADVSNRFRCAQTMSLATSNGQRTGALQHTVVEAQEQELSVERLVAECKGGSNQAFDSLVERYEKRIFNFLWQMTGNSHDAEDLAQETFLKVYRNLHRFNSEHGFTAWLFTIAKRTALNHFRGAKRFEELSPEKEVDLNDPSLELEQKDEKLSLWKIAASAVKPGEYEALWLTYGEGFSIAETARILKSSQIRVRVLLHRGRKHLGKRLGAIGHSHGTKMDRRDTNCTNSHELG
jgi:RNA polymerase sigma-70 factor (ECF subfamily)